MQTTWNVPLFPQNPAWYDGLPGPCQTRCKEANGASLHRYLTLERYGYHMCDAGIMVSQL